MVETGGKGGDVYFTVDPDVNTLINFRYNKRYKSESGQNGSGNHKYGKSGQDLYIKVPLGTIVKDSITQKVIIDLSNPGQTELVFAGGMRRERQFSFCHIYKASTKICTKWRKRNRKRNNFRAKIIGRRTD